MSDIPYDPLFHKRPNGDACNYSGLPLADGSWWCNKCGTNKASHEKQCAVRDLVVAVDRYIDRRNEVDQAVRNDLLRKMNAASERVAELFKVYPL